MRGKKTNKNNGNGNGDNDANANANTNYSNEEYISRHNGDANKRIPTNER